jgi:hypothetical protein
VGVERSWQTRMAICAVYLKYEPHKCTVIPSESRGIPVRYL